MDNSGAGGRAPPPLPPRSRTSSTSSLRSPSTAASQAPATPPRGTGQSPGCAGSLTPSRQPSTGSLGAVPFQGVSPDQLAGTVGGGGRVRCPSIASIDQISVSSRSSSIPPTPAPTPNPLLHVRFVLKYYSVIYIKHLYLDRIILILTNKVRTTSIFIYTFSI